MVDPRHVAPRVVPDRAGPPAHHRATAPYGLVRLAETPVPASVLHPHHDTDALLRSHERTVPGTHTGWIDLTLTTLTPTFVGQTRDGGGVTRSARLPYGDRALPTVPGSTLRGLIRNTVRMLTGGETGPVNTPMLFFRAPVRIDPDGSAGARSTRTRHVTARRHAHYRRRRAGLRTGQGFLYRSPEDGRWYVVEVAATALAAEPGRALKVSFPVLRESVATWDFGVEDFPDPPRGAAYVPTAHAQHGRLQHRWVYAIHHERGVVAVAPTEEEARAHAAVRTRRGGVIPALLVLTGAAAGERRNAYLFPRPTELDEGRHRVPEALLELFESAEQITDYQRKAFPATLSADGGDPGRPPVAGTPGGGLPRYGPEPVWFDADASGRVVSFGRSGGYRIAVGDDDPVRRALPPEVAGPQHGDHDLAERAGRTVDVCRAMFGDTDVFAGEAGALKGRVRFGNAVAADTDADLTDPAHPDGTVLRVRLLSPQRGCFANYLVQGPGAAQGDRPDIVTWSHEGDVRLGGYKVYLHRHRATDGPHPYDARAREELGVELPFAEGEASPPGPTQRDVVPLRAGVVLRARITFTNLTDAELGVLMRALLLDNPVDGGDPTDPEHAHKVGMGKSLGMGSVHLRPELHLVDRGARAADLSLRPDAGVVRASEDRVRSFLDAFSTALVGHRLSGPASPERWREVDQAGDVCLATRWRGRLPWEDTAVMSLRRFAEYPVLPSLVERFRRAPG
ncbi:TIGR03986 family CRISPR-associated RAMP protein [Nocardiopsis sp. MG754419]|uniref:TIGR03986 family type III CRISPR-associated RAMP protein n=1 Tax=Nocardiopsis sp. MG754419 TaxID=2259865 RepID=UPI001BA58C16|nr:TIGR03986 family CRISPR-associated RAMP protein [Nocardiopsis sp. MG754419]MBR8744486.1 TIGR03986 family CRISPR-associated RAMP protein [Nocardiopsis sp. MG754419]